MLKKPLQPTAKTCFITAMCLLLSTTTVFAAQQPDAGAVLQNSKDIEVKVPIAPPRNITIQEETTQSPASGGTTLTLRRFHITGQSLFAESQLTALLADQVGKELTFAELTECAGRITNYLRSQGYLVARAFIPAQESKDGELTIEVMMGTYGKIDIRNHSRLATTYIQSIVSPLKNGGYIKQDNLERALLLLSDSSGIGLKSTMMPGEQPGTSDLILEITDNDSLTGQLFSDNWGNSFTGNIRGGLNVTINNPTTIGDRLTIGGLYTGSGLHNGSVDYSLPTGSDGSKFGAGYSRVSYLLGKDYASLQASGTAKTTSLYETYPLLRSRNANLTIRLGYDRKELSDQITSQNRDSQKQSQALSLGLSGDRRSLAGDEVTSFDFTITNGHLTLNSADARSNDTSIQTAGNYTKANLSLLTQKYLNSRLSYSLALTGQLASRNLDSSEKFVLGGATGVRAYPQGEGAGDAGYLFTGELHWNMPTPKLQLALFVDSGQVTLNKNPWDGSTRNHRRLTDAGLGIIVNASNRYTLRLDYAWKVGCESAQSDTDTRGRFWLRGSTSF